MNAQGHIRRWDADKGFGFIQSAQSNSVFFHIRDYRAATPPQVGQAVTFEEIQVGGKGPRAMEVRPVGIALEPRSSQNPPPARPRTATSPGKTPYATAPRRPADASSASKRPRQRPTPTRSQSDTQPRGAVIAYLLMVYWLGLLVWAQQTQRLPLWLLGAMAALNLITFGFYWWDKNAAQQGAWRTPEQQLHLLALAGGWPGAWWAQQWLRHKSRKAEFRSMYWLTVLVHCGGLSLVLLHPKGQTLLQSLLGFAH
jgi:uncharacterized membrane protein YsdA (DUF1294 family)/cold shock CspA family protein